MTEEQLEEQHPFICVCCEEMWSLLSVEDSRIVYFDEKPQKPHLWMADGDCFPLNYCPFCGKKIELKKYRE